MSVLADLVFRAVRDGGAAIHVETEEEAAELTHDLGMSVLVGDEVSIGAPVVSR